MEHRNFPLPQAAGLSPAHLSAGSSSFTDFLRVQAPELLPGRRPAGSASGSVDAPHGTTVLAAVFRGGVLIAGDRRATSGNLIAYREMDKIYVTDGYSACGIAGAAGLGVELIRLYAVELEHYEKIEGVSLSLDGKTNKLAAMVRGNLDAAMAGLAAIPLFAGYDTEAADPDRAGRIVSFDVSGGRYEEHAGYHAIGSGSLFAKSALKKTHDPDADLDTTLRVAIDALVDAADDDSATGGPDMVRRLYPTAVAITGAEGAVRLTAERIAEVTEAVVADRIARGAEQRAL
jgi:proteasome beta subunit